MTPQTQHLRLDGPNTRQKGLTLVELVESVAITTVIMLAIGSSMLIATRALPDADVPANAAITASEAAEQIATELQYAVSINPDKIGATMIEFTVADRNGNDIPERIRYQWSGTPGASLTRQYNDGSVVNILDKVRQFNLSYDLETISNETRPGNESGETLLIGYSSLENLQDHPIKDAEWYGQYFRPVLPSGTVSWKVTRVRFFAKSAGPPNGLSKVQLQLPTAGKLPSGVVLEEKTLFESTLFVIYWQQQLTFSNVSNLSPEQGLCLVIRWVSDFEACKIWGRSSGVSTPNSYLVKSTNRGATWSAFTNQSLLFSVYGTVTTAGQPQVQQIRYLKGVEIKLRTGADAQSTVQTRARILNQPEVTQ